MKKMTIVLCFIGLIIVIGGGFLVNTFFIGKIMPVDRIFIKGITVEKSKINIQGGFPLDSALAFKDYKYRVDGSNLYIVIYRVLVSGIYKYDKVNITIDNKYSNIQNIYLEDSSKTILIWHKE